jgi:hypothetical protein
MFLACGLYLRDGRYLLASVYAACGLVWIANIKLAVESAMIRVETDLLRQRLND